VGKLRRLLGGNGRAFCGVGEGEGELVLERKGEKVVDMVMSGDRGGGSCAV